MARGLSDEPLPPEADTATTEETHEAIQELYSMVSFLFAKVDTLEKVIGHAVDLDEIEPEKLTPLKRSTFKGL